ncbi:DUF4214 domain-containing protein, partial [Klebsiella michiganensis]
NFGSTPLQVAQSFYGANAHGIHQMSNAEYVDFMYQSVLRRSADPDGRALYLDGLNSGSVGRAQLLLWFADSPE